MLAKGWNIFPVEEKFFSSAVCVPTLLTFIEKKGKAKKTKNRLLAVAFLLVMLFAVLQINTFAQGTDGLTVIDKLEPVKPDQEYPLNGADVLIFKQSTYAVVWSARELTAEEQEQIKACDNSNIEKWAFTTDRTFVLADKLGISGSGGSLKTRITVGETSFSFTNGSISHVVLIQVEKPDLTPTETPNPT